MTNRSQNTVRSAGWYGFWERDQRGRWIEVRATLRPVIWIASEGSGQSQPTSESCGNCDQFWPFGEAGECAANKLRTKLQEQAGD